MATSKKNILLSVSAIIVFSLLLSACSPTTSNVVKRWNDPDYQGPALKKILVIGIVKDNAKRQSFEKNFSSMITTSNRSGIASYTVIPNLNKTGKKQQILAAVGKTGADGVLMVTLLRVSKAESDDPATYTFLPTAGYGYGMYDYYDRSHSLIYNQGNTRTNTRVSLATKLFSVATEKMIWSATTESFNPSSAGTVTSELEKMVISDMQKSGMLK
ncbi:MAG TPA: hypothetical protein ENI64_05175 [Gammaproteobacteria bacterium]|nr:hypothetical protein [Gammaproteobacteria bacterium]